MPVKTEAQKRAQKKYMENISTIQIRLSHEDREKIKAFAAAHGLSVNAWIIQVLHEKIEKEAAEG